MTVYMCDHCCGENETVHTNPDKAALHLLMSAVFQEVNDLETVTHAKDDFSSPPVKRHWTINIKGNGLLNICRKQVTGQGRDSKVVSGVGVGKGGVIVIRDTKDNIKEPPAITSANEVVLLVVFASVSVIMSLKSLSGCKVGSLSIKFVVNTAKSLRSTA